MGIRCPSQMRKPKSFPTTRKSLFSPNRFDEKSTRKPDYHLKIQTLGFAWFPMFFPVNASIAWSRARECLHRAWDVHGAGELRSGTFLKNGVIGLNYSYRQNDNNHPTTLIIIISYIHRYYPITSQYHPIMIYSFWNIQKNSYLLKNTIW